MRDRVKSLGEWIDHSPRKGWYFATLLFLNYVWDVTGHWPL